MYKKFPAPLRKTIKYIAVFIVLCFIISLFRISAITTYVPFSGKNFDIDADEVDAFVIQYFGDYLYLNTPEDIEMMTNHLNNMRYRFCWLFVDLIPSAGEDGHWLFVQLKDGTSHRINLGSIDISIDNYVGAWIFQYPPEDLSIFDDLMTQRSDEIVQQW